MRGAHAAMAAMLAWSCLPTSHSIVNVGELAPSSMLRGSIRSHALEEQGGNLQGRRIPSFAIARRLELRGGAGTEVAKRTPYKPSVLKSTLTWTGKALIAAFSSLLTTSAAMVTFEFTAQKIHPAMAEAGMPDGLAALVTVGAVVGSVLGGYVIGKLSPSHPSLLALIVGLIFTAAQHLNLDAVQHPSWFPIAGLLSFVPPYLVAVAVTAAASPRTVRVSRPTPARTATFKAEDDNEEEEVAAKEDGKKDDGKKEGGKTPKSSAKTPAKTPRGKKSAKTPAKTPKSKKA